MRKRRNQGEEVGISLFPFLAVLLCTMGTLVVLLLVITDQARVQANEAAAVPAGAAKLSPEDLAGTWNERAEKLRASHAAVGEAVRDRRVQLGYLEEHTRELQTKIVELQASLAERQRLAQSGDEQVAKAEKEIERLRAQIAEASKNLDELRKENQNRPASYSIIPYDGPNRTLRRPVYIECHRDQVILQPEGIVLAEEDFLIADDPGNPLATTLRATREYLAAGASLSAAEEPYPLVIVRPDGVDAYYAVRQALQGWTSDFGYELVNDEWKLAFPPADPNLAAAQNRALAESRLRQKALIAMMDRKVKKSRKFRAAPGSGIVTEGHETGFGTAQIPYHGDEGDDGGDDESGGAHGGGGSAARVGEGRKFAGISMGGGHGATGLPRDDATGAETTGDASGGPRGNGAGKAPGGVAASNHHGPEKTAAQNLPGGRNGNANEIATSQTAAGGPNRAGSTRRGPPSRIGYYEGSTTPRAAKNAAIANNGAAGGPGGGEAAPSAGEGGYVAGQPDVALPADKSAAESLAKKRGRDWGLRYAEPTATPVTRPLRLVCHSDRIFVVSDDAKRPPTEIILKPKTADSVDEVVAAVWKEIEAWGIAGKGMYWRPILSFDVEPRGGERYEDFRRLLDGSGLDVRRRGQTAQHETGPAASNPATARTPSFRTPTYR